MKKHIKPKNFDFNLVIIGGGSAGLVSSFIASTVKSKVALIEKHKMGGDCLNTGCIPSKTLIATAKMLQNTRKLEKFGLKPVESSFDFLEVMQRVQSTIKKIAPNDSIDRYESLGVNCFSGEAKILSPYQVQIDEKVLTTKSIIIATGANPLIPKIEGLEKINFLTSNNLWNLQKLPQKMLVIGGGPIGLEMAQSFSRLGSKVTIVEMQKRILSKEDKEISDLIEKSLKNENIEILTEHQAVKFEIIENKKFLYCKNSKKELVKINFTDILLALGRQANTKNLGLENLQIELNNNGTIKTDKYLRTNYSNIYACGDVAGPYQFTHMAAHQSWYATVNSLFGSFKKFKVDYNIVPWIIFTDPEIARVGINEKLAIKQNIKYEAYTYPLNHLDRAITDNQDVGFIKVIVTPKGKILGASIASSQADSFISQFILAMKHDISLNDILKVTYAYPTMSEANKFLAGIWKKNHKPNRLLSFLEKFHRLRRTNILFK